MGRSCRENCHPQRSEGPAVASLLRKIVIPSAAGRQRGAAEEPVLSQPKELLLPLQILILSEAGRQRGAAEGPVVFLPPFSTELSELVNMSLTNPAA